MSTPEMTFDPNSNDAMFAKVLSKLDEQSAKFDEMRNNFRTLETEIASLKSWRDNLRGQIAVIAALVSAAASIVFQHVFK